MGPCGPPISAAYDVKHTGHEMLDKIATITRQHLASRIIKQLNEQVDIAILNIG